MADDGIHRNVDAGKVLAPLDVAASGDISVGDDLTVTDDLTVDAIAATGSIKSSSPTAGIGYATGAGAAATQGTNRTTTVVCEGICGTITTHNASLAAEAAAEFTVTNASVAIGDVIVLSQQSGSNGGNTAVAVTTVAAGSFKIKVSNNNAAAGTAETGAILINFAVIKAVSA